MYSQFKWGNRRRLLGDVMDVESLKYKVLKKTGTITWEYKQHHIFKMHASTALLPWHGLIRQYYTWIKQFRVQHGNGNKNKTKKKDKC